MHMCLNFATTKQSGMKSSPSFSIASSVVRNWWALWAGLIWSKSEQRSVESTNAVRHSPLIWCKHRPNPSHPTSTHQPVIKQNVIKAIQWGNFMATSPLLEHRTRVECCCCLFPYYPIEAMTTIHSTFPQDSLLVNIEVFIFSCSQFLLIINCICSWS
jgi:hypothetical protein